MFVQRGTRQVMVVTKSQLMVWRNGTMQGAQLRLTNQVPKRVAYAGMGGLLVVAATFGDVVHCAGNEEVKALDGQVVGETAEAKPQANKPESDEDPFDLGFAGHIGMSTALGFASGFFLKKAGKVALVVVGLGVVAIQGLRMAGIITENPWPKASKMFEKTMDLDGDGQVTMKDAKVGWDRIISLLSADMPGRAAFAAAALLGFRQG